MLIRFLSLIKIVRYETFTRTCNLLFFFLFSSSTTYYSGLYLNFCRRESYLIRIVRNFWNSPVSYKACPILVLRIQGDTFKKQSKFFQKRKK